MPEGWAPVWVVTTEVLSATKATVKISDVTVELKSCRQSAVQPPLSFSLVRMIGFLLHD
jgi:hypothetical protein